jgi:hypothetical protein
LKIVPLFVLAYFLFVEEIVPLFVLLQFVGWLFEVIQRVGRRGRAMKVRGESREERRATKVRGRVERW